MCPVVGAVVVLLVVGIVTPAQAFSGFSNPAPIMAMLVPQVTTWAHRHGQSPSRYLMPLSFAAILGGLLTFNSTSTNLVVSGLLTSVGEAPLGMFELTPVGLPIAVVGVCLVLFLAPRVLPDRSPARDDLSEGFREFVVKMAVVGGGPLDGRSVGEGRLRNLKGVFLVEIEREGEVIAPVTPHTMLSGGDLLTFVGRVDDVVDLQTTRGLMSNEHKHLEKFDTARHSFFEVVLGPASPLVGRTLKAADFRDRYQAAVVAIHRAGRLVSAKLGGVVLKPVDTLLVLSDPGFGNRWRDRSAFLLVARLGGVTPAATKKAWVVGAVVLGVVLSAALGLLPVLHAGPGGRVRVGHHRRAHAGRSPRRGRPRRDSRHRRSLRSRRGTAGVRSGRACGRAARGDVRRLGFGGRHDRHCSDDRDADQHHQQQCRRGPDVPDFHLHGVGPRPEHQGIRNRRGHRGLGVVSDPDRVSDQHHGVRAGRLSVRRLCETRCSADPRRRGRHRVAGARRLASGLAGTGHICAAGSPLVMSRFLVCLGGSDW